MTTEYWFLAAVGGLMVLALVFFAGRGMSPAQRRLDEMRRERDQARAEAERVQGEVARHFEQSARMFGRLADDYRLFFEHFAETAQNLGLSEGRARELLHRADPRLVAAHAGQDARGEAAGSEDPAGEDTGRDDTAPASDRSAVGDTGTESEAVPREVASGSESAAATDGPQRPDAAAEAPQAGDPSDGEPGTEAAMESGAEAAEESLGERRN